jgi:hypothetical protein
MHLRGPEGDNRPARVVEGVVLEISTGRDGRTRLRIGIPTGSGDPVEVRVLLDGIERVELATEETAVQRRPTTDTTRGPVRRETLAFGAPEPRDSGVRLSREPPAPSENPDVSTPAIRTRR